jgi:hypothetical protein
MKMYLVKMYLHKPHKRSIINLQASHMSMHPDTSIHICNVAVLRPMHKLKPGNTCDVQREIVNVKITTLTHNSITQPFLLVINQNSKTKTTWDHTKFMSPDSLIPEPCLNRRFTGWETKIEASHVSTATNCRCLNYVRTVYI